MWKIAVFVLVVIFVIADSIYLYFRLKHYWRNSSWRRSGQQSSKWKIGLSSLDIPLGKKTDDDTSPPENK